MENIEITQGETETLSLYLTEDIDGTQTPIDLTGKKILFTIKSDLKISDEKAIIKKDIEEHEDQSTKTGYTNILLSREDMQKEVGEYWMDIWLVAGTEYRQVYPSSKTFKILPTVSRRE